MYYLTPFILVSLAISVTALIPRTAPSSWYSGLEPYGTYHSRYMNLGCPSEHNTDFFSKCCHPLMRGNPGTSLPAECNPGDDLATTPVYSLATTGSETSSAYPTPVPTRPSRVESTCASDPNSSYVHTGGIATYYNQNGVAGNCGKEHNNSDYIGALPTKMYGQNNEYCGWQIKVTNTENGRSVEVTIADSCPTCNNTNSIDLSVAAFQQIGDLNRGEYDISWYWVRNFSVPGE